MANIFKNYTVSCTDTSASLTIDVKVAGKFLIKGAPVPVGSALSVLDGKIIGEATDTVTVTSSDASGDVDVIVSVLRKLKLMLSL